MFSEPEKAILQDALQLSINSTKRAKNTSKNPLFLPIYDQMIADLETIKAKLAPNYTELAKQQISQIIKK